MIEQLIKKDCKTGEYANIYPITILSNVIDPDTKEPLDTALEKYNHIFLPFKDNSRILTRRQVPSELRRRGLWITYISCKGETVTEWFDGDKFDDVTWGCSKNWVPYISEDLIINTVNKLLGWYKA